jgi:spermidine synthase
VKDGEEETFLLESLTPDFGHFVRATRLIYSGRTPFQKIELFEAPQFGKTLRLDNVFQTSVGDEFFYHEMMVHPALIAHPAPERVLIVGAGDGGMAEEVLKHRTVREVVMVELDEAVIRFAREHLGEIHRGCFDDPRMTLHIGDGFRFVEQAAARGERFDAAILDLTDPIGPSRPLYTVEFYQMVAALLGEDGIQVHHVETPVTRPRMFRQLIANVTAAYREVHPLLQYVPLYGTLWAFCNAAQRIDPRRLDADTITKRIDARGLTDLKVYNAETHRAAYAQPTFVRELLAQPAEPIHLDQVDRFDPIVALCEATDDLRIVRESGRESPGP